MFAFGASAAYLLPIELSAWDAAYMERRFCTSARIATGAIRKADAATGGVKHYSEIPKSSPGLGDLVFDPTIRSLYSPDSKGLCAHGQLGRGRILPTQPLPGVASNPGAGVVVSNNAWCQ